MEEEEEEEGWGGGWQWLVRREGIEEWLEFGGRRLEGG